MKGFERFCITSFFVTTQIRRPESLCKKNSITFSVSYKKDVFALVTSDILQCTSVLYSVINIRIFFPFSCNIKCNIYVNEPIALFSSKPLVFLPLDFCGVCRNCNVGCLWFSHVLHRNRSNVSVKLQSPF